MDIGPQPPVSNLDILLHGGYTDDYECGSSSGRSFFFTLVGPKVAPFPSVLRLTLGTRWLGEEALL